MKRAPLLSLLLVLILSGCGAYFNQPVGVEKAAIGEPTPSTSALKLLPPPKEPVVIGVYKFRDQTGQYKPTETGSTFSTAVTQGATSILIKALEDSKWFTPIERENLANLMNERNIIRSTRQEYNKDQTAPEMQLAPLLYAGVLLEGGVISYDSNIITGGYGARYFGAGGSTRYKQDRITIYLRLVSTSNGKILKTIYVSKTILSQSVDASLFRYVDFKRLLEVETGFTKNEPIQMAITEAIEKGVEGLIIEGIRDNIWEAKAPIAKLTELINNYDAEKQDADVSALYGRHFTERRARYGVEIGGGTTLINGDYPNAELKPMIRGGLKYFFWPNFNMTASLSPSWFGNKNYLEVGYLTGDLNFELLVLPYDRCTPYIYGGGGMGINSAYENLHTKIQFGLGVEYLLTDNFGIKLYGENNITFSDKVDYLVMGKRDDYYWRFGAGITYYFPKQKYPNKAMKKHVEESKRATGYTNGFPEN